MALSFPTGPRVKHNSAGRGYPRHPEPRHMCHCGVHRMLDDIGSCMRCGRFPAATISETWERRKHEIAMSGDKIRRAAAELS